MKIIFYNTAVSGDKAHSRGIASYIAQYVPENIILMFFSPHHNLSARSMHVDKRIICVCENDNISLKENYYYDGDTMFVNVCITAYPQFMNPNRPNFGVSPAGLPYDYTSDHTFNHAKEIIDQINLKMSLSIPYPVDESDILPRTNLNPPRKNKVDLLIEKLSVYKKRVLLCNNLTYSGQSTNFIISDTIKQLVIDNPDVAFVYTCKDKADVQPNDYFIDDIFSIPNFNEIEYLSRYCDILISRQSGAGCVIQTYENMFDTEKVYISLTVYDENTAFYFKNGNCRYDRTTDFSTESVTNIIKKYL